MKKYAVIGGGVAAFEAANQIRQNDSEAQIDIYSAESVMPYRRIALSRMMFENLSDLQFFIKPASYFEEKKLNLHLNAKVEAINPEQSTLLLNGKTIDFDRLIIADGARCFVPPVIDASLNEILTFRNFADLEKLKKITADKNLQLAILGGGLLGLELADGLCKLGIKADILEVFPLLLGRQLDEEASLFFRRRIEQCPGLKIHTSFKLQSLQKVNGKLEITATDRTKINCDYLLISSGIAPEKTLAESAGIKCNHGIIVNEFMETSHPGIYAAGDCAEFQGRIFGLYAPAQEMGKICGHNCSSELKKCYEPCKNSNPVRLNVFNTKLFSMGKIPDIEVKTESDDENFSRIFSAGGKITGAILIGDTKQAVKLQQEIE